MEHGKLGDIVGTCMVVMSWVCLLHGLASYIAHAGAGSLQSKAAAKNAAKRRNKKGKAGGGDGDDPDTDAVSAAEAGEGPSGTLPDNWVCMLCVSALAVLPGTCPVPPGQVEAASGVKHGCYR